MEKVVNLDDEMLTSLPFSTQNSALDCQQYLLKRLVSIEGQTLELKTLTLQKLNLPQCNNTNIYFCIFPKMASMIAKEYWTHTGTGISSRLAQDAVDYLQEQKTLTNEHNDDDVKFVIRQRISDLLNEELPSLEKGNKLKTSEKDVYLFPSGMSAIYQAFQLVTRLFPGRQTVQFG